MRTDTAGATSDRGAVRTENQDDFYVGEDLWIVADGMGGHDGGQAASFLATITASQALVQPAVEIPQLCVRLSRWPTGSPSPPETRSPPAWGQPSSSPPVNQTEGSRWDGSVTAGRTCCVKERFAK